MTTYPIATESQADFQADAAGNRSTHADELGRIVGTWINLKHRGAKCDGLSDDTTVWQDCLAEVKAAGGGTLLHPGGISCVDSASLVVDFSGLRLIGMGRHRSLVKGTGAGLDLFQIGAGGIYYFSMEHMGAVCDSTAGTIFAQQGFVAMSSWTDVYMEQNNPAERIYHNPDAEDYVDNIWLNFEMQHVAGASVSPFVLYGTTGANNANTWQRGRVTYSSGTTPFFVVENDVAPGNNYAYDNEWRGITAEVCPGGVIALKGCFGSVLDHVSLWDSGTMANDAVFVGASASGTGSVATTIIDYGRRSTPLGGHYDIKLETGNVRHTTIINALDASQNSLAIDGGSTTGQLVGALPSVFHNQNAFNIQGDIAAVPVRYPSWARPDATTVPIGGMIYDTDTLRPYFTDGTDWLNALGALDDWVTYSPTLAGSGWAIGDGTITGKHMTLGSLVFWRVSIEFGASSTFGGSAAPTVSLPSTAAAFLFQQVSGVDTGSNNYQLAALPATSTKVACCVAGTNGVISNVTATSPFTWTNGDILSVFGIYEAA